MKIAILPELFCVCRLENSARIPAWVRESTFYSITKTTDELSIVCEQKYVPLEMKTERNFRALKVLGPLDFSLTGILSSIAGPLSEGGISIFAISTFDTDYILVRDQNLEKASVTLRIKGFEVLKDE